MAALAAGQDEKNVQLIRRLLEMVETRVLSPRMFGGLRDTLRILQDVARG